MERDRLKRLCREEGYAWCGSCQALTPHVPFRENGTWDDSDMECEACWEIRYKGKFDCPTCRWSPSDDMLEEPEEIKMKVHVPECCYGELFEYEKDLAVDVEKQKCDCSEVTIYQHPWMVSVTGLDGSEETVYFEWKIRCPVCGEVYEVEVANDRS